jgi:hypothetical protein
VTVGNVVAARVSSWVGASTVAVGCEEEDRAALGDGDTAVTVDEAVGEGGTGVGVLVAGAVGETKVIEADSGVEEMPNEERHAVRKVPTAAKPKPTKRRRDMRPSRVISGSQLLFSSLSGFTVPPVYLASQVSEPSYVLVFNPARDLRSVRTAA